jgi:hypothetical protein
MGMTANLLYNFIEGKTMPKKAYFFVFVCAVSFCINAMENKKWMQEWYEARLASDKAQRAQLCCQARGKLYEKICDLLDEQKQETKDFKHNASMSEYTLYKHSYRSCPNRAKPYPGCPGMDNWRDCPTCYPIFEKASKGTQQYILKKKVILREKWNLYVMYGDGINLSNYYCDIENPRNDLINFKLFRYHN